MLLSSYVCRFYFDHQGRPPVESGVPPSHGLTPDPPPSLRTLSPALASSASSFTCLAAARRRSSSSAPCGAKMPAASVSCACW
eukprot:366068-Chlamydomonas_euryale.AAC.5